ncbi:hypothetical protein [Loktanella sp. SALINAS62]|uniref:hypothetical protein n=1 Tax=Loktanella sp. SALINAS62 TaxID=2706124 RepID=UPI001B8D6035|nr:hypothetical protein [Loktanella sp. SALINAS62]MBS1304035.1 hypothetical protein [Loktanella sp. SALINAS62]
MKFRCLVVSWLLCICNAVAAGPWARQQDQTFIAIGGNFLLSEGAELPVHYDPTLYVEYGLRPELTLGFDFHSANKGDILSGFTFARIPLGDPENALKTAAALGVGFRRNSDTTEELLIRPGFSLGQSLPSGWLAFDGTVTYGAIDSKWRPKADFTWGQSWSPRWTTTFQVQTGMGFSDDHYAKVSPTMIYTANDRFKINFGAVRGLTGDKGSALKLETWITY